MKAATETGQLRFTNITAAAGLAATDTGSHGAFWADATGDGRPDLFLTYNECRSGMRRNFFYRNLGGGRFVEEAEAVGLASWSGGSHGAAWVDLDNDGDYDLLNGRTYATACPTDDVDGLPNQILRNDGGVFTDVTPAGMASYADYTRSIAGMDLDGDGDLDIVAVNGDKGTDEAVPDRNEVYRNEGGLRFSAITAGAIVSAAAGQGAAETDYDGDGDVDLLMPNRTGELAVLRNDGAGAFTQVPPSLLGIQHRAASGVSSGDLDNDGLIDLVLVDRNRDGVDHPGFNRVAYLYLNAGGGRFTHAASIAAGTFGGFSAGLADLDNDGDLDLVLPGMAHVLLNDGHAGFTEGPLFPGPQPSPSCVGGDCTEPDPRTVAFADIDGDGDLDSVVTAKYGVPALIRTDVTGGHWIDIALVSPKGQAGAFGARVRVTRPGTGELLAFREAKNAFGYLAQNDPVLHVGLGAVTTVDVSVTFVDGTEVTSAGVAADGTIVMSGRGALVPPDAPQHLQATVDGRHVRLSWTPSSGGTPAGEYLVEVGSATGTHDLARFQVTQTALEADASPGVYYTRVRGEYQGAPGPASDEVVVRVGTACVPEPPTGLTWSAAGDTVTLAWTAPAGPPVASYHVEAGSRPGAADLAVFSQPGDTTRLVATAPPGTYHVRIRALTACGTSEPTEEVVVTVGGPG
ncbi:MAG: FG-GAP-like repeat-containing protein [Vicinamibacterales bacterium]